MSSNFRALHSFNSKTLSMIIDFGWRDMDVGMESQIMLNFVVLCGCLI